MQKITPCLWYDGRAKEAAEHYVAIFGGDSRIGDITYYGAEAPGETGSVLTVDFRLAGQDYIALNGGPQFPFTEAISLSVDCADQAEVDRFWAALSEGGEEGQCGWLKDKFGVSWQVVPNELQQLVTGPDKARAERAVKAMLGMGKLDIQALRDA
ncbi:VOC family protein [Streptomyces sp. NPDC091289]|uniref:VOC family protein n=1 Tax=Streptomyces sp. NPDC091289 TaxID=3365989 RepID=UPI0037F41ED7